MVRSELVLRLGRKTRFGAVVVVMVVMSAVAVAVFVCVVVLLTDVNVWPEVMTSRGVVTVPVTERGCWTQQQARQHQQ